MREGRAAMWQGQDGGLRGLGPAGYRRNDARIREDVCDRLTDDRGIDASEIEVEVAAGEVTLRGHVPERAMRRQAELLAERVAGVAHVQNDLRVARAGDAAGAEMPAGWGTPVAAAYGLAASPSADAPAAGEVAIPREPPAAREASALKEGPAAWETPAAWEARSDDALAAAQAALDRAPTAREGQVTVAALFDAFADAEAAQHLLIETGTGRERLAILDHAAVQAGEPAAEAGLIGTLKTLLSPAAEAVDQAPALRRGGAVLTAAVAEGEAERVAMLLRDHGATEVDQRRGTWRAIGWREYEPDAAALTG